MANISLSFVSVFPSSPWLPIVYVSDIFSNLQVEPIYWFPHFSNCLWLYYFLCCTSVFMFCFVFFSESSSLLIPSSGIATQLLNYDMSLNLTYYIFSLILNTIINLNSVHCRKYPSFQLFNSFFFLNSRTFFIVT